MNAPAGFKFVKDPDLETVSKLIYNNWDRPCQNYTAEVLACYLSRPTGDRSLAIGIETDEGELVSYQAHIPYEIELNGKKLKTAFQSFVTVDKNFRGNSLSSIGASYQIQSAIKQDFDAIMKMCEVGAVYNYVIAKTFKENNLKVNIIKTFNYIAGLNQFIVPILPPHKSGYTSPYAESDKTEILNILGQLGGNTQLRKIIDPSDINYIFSERPSTKSYVYKKNKKVMGLINLLFLEVLDKDSEKILNVYFDHVAFGEMSHPEQEEFIGDILLDIQNTGFHTAFLPDIGYVNTNPFKKWRFRAAPRKLNLYLSVLKDDNDLKSIESIDTFFLDVY